MAAKEINEDGWREYQKLVLSELERSDENYKSLNAKLDQLLALQTSLADIKKWKEEKAEPDLQSLKEFRSSTKTYGVITEVVIAGIVSFIIAKISTS